MMSMASTEARRDVLAVSAKEGAKNGQGRAAVRAAGVLLPARAVQLYRCVSVRDMLGMRAVDRLRLSSFFW